MKLNAHNYLLLVVDHLHPHPHYPPSGSFSSHYTLACKVPNLVSSFLKPRTLCKGPAQPLLLKPAFPPIHPPWPIWAVYWMLWGRCSVAIAGRGLRIARRQPKHTHGCDSGFRFWLQFRISAALNVNIKGVCNLHVIWIITRNLDVTKRNAFSGSF